MNRTQLNLITLCKLWGMVKLFHPALAWRTIDWDGALVAAIPAVKAAADARTFADAVSGMLAVLGDPATGVTAPEPPAEARRDATPAPPQPPALLLDDVLLATLADGDSADAHTRLEAIAAHLPDTKAVVFDLRRAAPSDDADWAAWHFDEAMAKWLCTDAVATDIGSPVPGKLALVTEQSCLYARCRTQRFAFVDKSVINYTHDGL